ncbi:MAG: helix-turn-helix transcriptional regulator [Burkholderiaceae bacterium]
MADSVKRNLKAMTEPYWNPSSRTVSNEAKKAFATRLYARMVELGWTQADLARHAFGVENDKIIDREKVSLWLRGLGLPGELKMRKLACALNMTLAELAPPIEKSPLERAAARNSDEAPRTMKLRRPVALTDFATVQLQPGGKVILQLTLPNELAQTVMEFAKKKLEHAAA